MSAPALSNRVSSVVSGAVVLAAASVASAAIVPRYTVTDLGTLPGGNNSYAFDINNHGVVVGGANVTPGGLLQPTVFAPGKAPRSLGLPTGAAAAVALGVNNSNKIVGGVFPHFAQNRLQMTDEDYLGGFSWEPTDASTVPPPGGPVSHPEDPFFNGPGTLAARTKYMSINGISETSGVAGTVLDGFSVRAAAGSLSGNPTSLGVLVSPSTAGAKSRATNVTAGGLVVGYSDANGGRVRGFVGGSGGIIGELGADFRLNGQGDSRALGATDGVFVPSNTTVPTITTPVAVGWADSLDGNHRAALWSAHGGAAPVFYEGLAGTTSSEAADVNNRGVAVGNSIVHGFDFRATVFVNGKAYDANQLVTNSSGFFRLNMATAINDKGQIVGYGTTNLNNIHAFILNPIPVANVGLGTAGDPTDPTPGKSQQHPILPSATSGETLVFADVPSGAWIDPEPAEGLRYTLTTPGAAFTSITIPDSFAGLSVAVDGEVVASDLAPLSQLTFNYAVTSFDVIGFDPGLDTTSPGFFPLQVSFTTPTASLELQPLYAPVPEPAGCVLFAVAPFALRRRTRD